jgi:hypothetical protein
MDGLENRSMIILLAFVNGIGGSMTLALLWPYGAPLAILGILGMCFGASALVLAVSVLIDLQKSEQAIEPEALQDQSNALASDAS